MFINNREDMEQIHHRVDYEPQVNEHLGWDPDRMGVPLRQV